MDADPVVEVFADVLCPFAHVGIRRFVERRHAAGRDDVRLHSVARRTDDGWYADAQLLQQEAGLRWSGGVDPYGATLLAGCDGTRRLGDLLAVLASSAGLSEGEAAEQVLPVVEQLVLQGFLVP